MARRKPRAGDEPAWVREGARQEPTKTAPTHCPVDGVALDAQGWCIEGRAYAMSAPCPFVCPYCRHPLTWSGGCEGCYGDPSGQRKREAWSFPGDRYELEAGHYVKVCGPRPAVSAEESATNLKAVLALLAEAPALTGKPPRRRKIPRVDEPDAEVVASPASDRP